MYFSPQFSLAVLASIMTLIYLLVLIDIAISGIPQCRYICQKKSPACALQIFGLVFIWMSFLFTLYSVYIQVIYYDLFHIAFLMFSYVGFVIVLSLLWIFYHVVEGE